MRTMHVYQVIEYYWGEASGTEPLYHTLSSAVAKALSIVNEKQKSLDDEREFFTKEEGYNDFRKVENYVWKGGFQDDEEIRIETVRIAK